MRIRFKNLPFTELEIMRKVGYQAHPKGLGYMRRVKPGGSFYPRFHIKYLAGDPESVLDLHYDWRRPMHVKEARSSDNDGEVVEQEAKRIAGILDGLY